MIKLELEQGCEAWHAHRATARNASEASVLMGECKQYRRTDFIKHHALGVDNEVSDFVRDVVFAKGHQVEEVARQFAEEIVGGFLDACVGTDDEGFLSASLDGLSEDGVIAFECKQWNADKADMVRDGYVPECDKWQCVQGLAVSGADRCLYMVSDGTKEGSVYCYLERNEDDIKRLIQAWILFGEEVASYVHVERPILQASPTSTLPDVVFDMKTIVNASNLEEIKEQSLAVFKDIKTELVTDQDFADAKVSAEWCRGIAKKLKVAKEKAINSDDDARAVFEAIDEIMKAANAKGLEQEKLVKAENVRIRADLKSSAERDLSAFISNLSNDFSWAEVNPDFAGAMKNKRSIGGLEEGVSVELNRCKLDAAEFNARIDNNTKRFDELVGELGHVFHDKMALVRKDSAVMELDVSRRMADFKEREDIRIQSEKRRKAARLAEAPRAVEINHGRIVAPSDTSSSGNFEEYDSLPGDEPLRKTVEMVTITKKEYDSLKDSEFKLECLIDGGVDNWGQYSESLKPYYATHSE